MLFQHPALKARLDERTQYDPFGGCWLWSGYGAGSNGAYGELSFNGKRILAHRASYECYVGPIEEDLRVCHRCDVPACINPAHLFLGTAKDNTHDMVRKGRGGRPPHIVGAAHHKAQLTEAQVLEARRRRANGEKVAALAAEYGISVSALYGALNGRSWKHLPLAA